MLCLILLTPKSLQNHACSFIICVVFVSMANLPVDKLLLLVLLILSIVSLQVSSQLQVSQYQTLVRIQQLLNFPSVLSTFSTTTLTDFCNIQPTSSLTLICYQDNLTQLHITGNGLLAHYNFSADTFFTTLGGLSSLKVLSLVSLGLWGPLPGNIALLSSLEILNLSSNYFSGSIPVQVSSLRNLQTLILDNNYFTGTVPSELSSLEVLSFLSVNNNSLSGVLPNSLTSLQTLRVLSLSANHLSGEIPDDLHRLKNLQVLDVQDNYFGPHFPILNKKLVTLVLRNNRFQFGIPNELASYNQIQKLDISLNGFVGPFNPSLLSLPSINYLDVHGNKLTGLLFQNMSCNHQLAHVDLSSNLMKGDLPSCLQLGAKNRIVLYSKNCLSNEEQEQHPSSFCHNEALAVKVLPHKQKKNRTLYASSMVGGTVGGITIVGVVLLVIKKVYCKNNNNLEETTSTRSTLDNVSTINTLKLLSDARYISLTMKMGASLPAYRTFALEELKEATDNFDASGFMGDDSHGQIYRGKLADGTLVAIRSLKMSKPRRPYMYTHYIELVSKLRHSNLVSALGHCFDFNLDDSSINTMYLIFEYAAPNRTLRSFISGSGRKLAWVRRITAAIGVAKGVQFLHTGIVPGVFSNNLKITDVLLDEDLRVKISSYNLPLLAEATSKVSAEVSICRTQQSDKGDVYDIGVILLEIVVGRPIMSKNDAVLVKDLLQVSITTNDAARRSIVDPAVKNECSDESLKRMMELCVRCLCNEPKDRPSIEDILWNLQFATQIQNSTQNNYEAV